MSVNYERALEALNHPTQGASDPDERDTDLIGEFSAMVWAERFVLRVTENPAIATDVGAMCAWFASAIMAGYDHPRGGANDA